MSTLLVDAWGEEEEDRQEASVEVATAVTPVVTAEKTTQQHKAEPGLARQLARIEASHAELRAHVRVLFVVAVALLIIVAVQRAGIAELRGRIDGLLLGLGGGRRK